MKHTSAQIGKVIRDTRKSIGVTQKDLALTSGTGIRFIIDLEHGKETCQIGKTLVILNTLGIRLALTPPAVPTKECGFPDDIGAVFAAVRKLFQEPSVTSDA